MMVVMMMMMKLDIYIFINLFIFLRMLYEKCEKKVRVESLNLRRRGRRGVCLNIPTAILVNEMTPSPLR
jgi:hypothetical protein